MESKLDYVTRKLQDKQINLTEIAKRVGTTRPTLYKLVNKKDGQLSLVDKLYKHLKTLGD